MDSPHTPPPPLASELTSGPRRRLVNVHPAPPSLLADLPSLSSNNNDDGSNKSGQYFGLGLTLEPDPKSKHYIVAGILADSDAAHVVRLGDLLIGVDEFDTGELGGRQLKRLLMGAEGSEVTLTLVSGKTTRIARCVRSVPIERSSAGTTPISPLFDDAIRPKFKTSDKHLIKEKGKSNGIVWCCVLVGCMIAIFWLVVVVIPVLNHHQSSFYPESSGASGASGVPVNAFQLAQVRQNAPVPPPMEIEETLIVTKSGGG